ncbi:MAG: adenine phosphoribosyltransferase, partial [Chloroflexi bacterium]|nr:adenine phosphoribosyltransferase [Chloroflexota bacterium]
AFRYAIDELTGLIAARAPDAIVAVESRGFLFGAPVAERLSLPLVPVRKAGKLPSERMSVEFSLEYGESQLDIHTDALERGQQIVIVDDLLATGGTAAAAAKLVERLGARVRAIAFLVELAYRAAGSGWAGTRCWPSSGTTGPLDPTGRRSNNSTVAGNPVPAARRSPGGSRAVAVDSGTAIR